MWRKHLESSPSSPTVAHLPFASGLTLTRAMGQRDSGCPSSLRFIFILLLDLSVFFLFFFYVCACHESLKPITLLSPTCF